MSNEISTLKFCNLRFKLCIVDLGLTHGVDDKAIDKIVDSDEEEDSDKNDNL